MRLAVTFAPYCYRQLGNPTPVSALAIHERSDWTQSANPRSHESLDETVIQEDPPLGMPVGGIAMELERSVVTDLSPKEAETRIGQYFTFLGYRPVGPGNSRFRRGSSVGSMTAFNPKKWASQASVTFSEQGGKTQVHVTWHVSSTGQILTAKDRVFWATEADELENALIATGPFAIHSLGVAEASASQGATATLVAGVVAVVSGAVCALFLPLLLAILVAAGITIFAFAVVFQLLGRRGNLEP